MRKKSIFSYYRQALIGVTLFACSDPTAPTTIANISVNAPGTTSIASGGQLQLAARLFDSKNNEVTGRTIKWTSSNPSLATVSEAGLVTAGKVVGGIPENVTVQATVGTVSGSVALSIMPLSLSRIVISPDSVRMSESGTAQLTLQYFANDGTPLTGRTASFVMTDSSFATITQVGRITSAPYLGPNIRETRAIATAEGRADTVRVIVTPRTVGSIALSVETHTGTRGSSLALTWITRDSVGTLLPDRKPVWTSTDSLVAGVSTTGVLTLSGSGHATVTAVVDGKSDTALVSVIHSGAQSIDASSIASTCAVTTSLLSGNAVCWGYNLGYQLGNGTTVRGDTATRISGALTLKSLSAASSTSCAVTVSGATYCWGGAPLGNNTGFTTFSSVPVAVSGGYTANVVATGGSHSCILLASGDVRCWGSNQYGQTGTGSGSLVPALVVGGRAFAALTAGNNHTCALTADGEVYCWGRNNQGQIGDGGTTDRSQPTRVNVSTRMWSISAGGDFTCGLSYSGIAFCWGDNSFGQLGDGGRTSRATPVRVGGANAFKQISAGELHACAVVRDGSGYCWGQNADGQLGNGTTTDATVPTKIAGSFTLTAIATGRDHSCARVSTGAVSCWGSNTSAQFGVNTPSLTRSLVPVNAATGVTVAPNP